MKSTSCVPDKCVQEKQKTLFATSILLQIVLSHHYKNRE